MGQKHSSKHSSKVKQIVKTHRNLTTTNSDSNIRVDSASKYDEKAIKTLKIELEQTPEIFVLNNILISVMFFENYRKDVLKLAHSTTTKMEKELNSKLLRDETIECITPDPIFEKLNKNVKFRPLHGPKKHSAEPLMPKRIYVVNDYIEVYDSMELPHYTAIDKQGYQAQVEESEHPGFVKLKLLEPSLKCIDFERKVNVQVESTTSEQSLDKISSYSAITEIKTPKPLNTIDCERRDTLPKTCFAIRKVPKITENYNESDDSSSESEETEDDLYQNIAYISSEGFMTYFQNGVFPNSLGRAIGFDQHEISLAKAIPGMIFCNLLDDDDNVIPCEITPSVAIQWPVTQTFEFEMREERPTITDYTTGIRYRWPTNEMIHDLKTLSCVLVPKGYFEKIGTNKDDEIEWEIYFPRAERYIESRMSHAQFRSFLYLLTLFRSFIEPVTARHGLLAEHIRSHMYWECEGNYMKWPEHQLGSKLMSVLENLKMRLSKGQLPHYFIKQKNLFENIPNKYLRFAQKTIHDILESPVMYFIAALRNLRYTSSKFYTPLNFKELYAILTTDGIKYINRNVDMDIPRGIPIYRRRKHQDPEAEWKRKKELFNRDKILKKQKVKIDETLNETRRASIDSINLEWTCDKSFDSFKTRSLLLFFIKHFIEISRKSRQLSTKEQTLFYLKQAYYLAKLLEKTDGCLADAKEYLDVILKEEETCKKMNISEIIDHPPSTPKRNSVQFNWEITQQVKSNNIHLNNLSNSYNVNGLISNSMPNSIHKIKRNVSNIKKKNLKIVTNGERNSTIFLKTTTTESDFSDL